MLKTKACTSNVKVTLKGQRSKGVLFDSTLPCLDHISTMHHRISKKLGTNVNHDEVACCIVLFDRIVPCPTCISTMHHRIPKLLGTHVHLKCQGHT